MMSFPAPTSEWLGAPCCLRGTFAFYKSFSCRKEQEAGRPAVWKLGEFYFLRCGPQEPVCIGELTLLWEDRAQRHLLASARLYFLPEDTPKGRTSEHGEDEVLAVSKKIVIRVEDLVSWTCVEPCAWKRSLQKFKGTDGCNGTSPAMTSEPGEQKAESVAPVERQKVKVLSYLQYCRFRSLQRRIQDRPDPSTSPDPLDPHLLALGGIRKGHHDTLILYCRDTFNHPTLENNANIWTQLGCTSLSLKGRPRKRRGRDGKGLERSPLNQSESWIERMKENVMGSVDVPWEGGWLPHPEEQPFLDQLYAFMERRGSPISKVPNLGFKKIDLFLLFSVVKRLGGYERVTSERLWKRVYNELGGCPGSTSAATCTRRHYEKLMLAYEQHLTGEEVEPPKPQLTSVASKSKEVPKGTGTVANQKTRSSPNVLTNQGVPARKRGRPPSRRNSKVTAKMPCAEATPPPAPQTPAAAGHQGALVFPELNLWPLKNGLRPPTLDVPELGQPKAELAGGKLEGVDSLSPSSLSALTRLHMSKPLGSYGLPKSLCPLELFRARVGLGGVRAGGAEPESSAPLQLPPVVLYPPKAAAADLTDRRVPCAGPRGEEGGHKGCTSEPSAGDSASDDACRSRAPMPPLRILPLDIDCSLQVRQLMRTRLGSAQLNSFARRLTEVLAQDLSRARPTAPPTGPAEAGQEQTLPLNLSKRCTAKRSAEEAGLLSDGDLPVSPKRGRGEWGLLSTKQEGPLGTHLLAEQDEPADLSCPRRARAQGMWTRDGAASSLANGDGGGTWDGCSDTLAE
ncbi:hypothetical protein GJAV_G00135290 [Gymnothorax javanicus]|nr:hypothetical protein GJAV_G00135290 [Gymnothorax javanicus]